MPSIKWHRDQECAIEGTGHTLVVERACVPGGILLRALVAPNGFSFTRKSAERAAVGCALLRLPLGAMSEAATFERCADALFSALGAQCYRADGVRLYIFTGGLAPAVALHHKSSALSARG